MLTTADTLTLIGFILTAFSLIPLYQEMFIHRRERKPNFEIERIVEANNTKWSIRIRNPNRTIERLNVLVGTTPLIVEDGILPFETKITLGGGQNFRIPLEKVNPSQERVFVRNGDKILKKIKFKDIVPTKP